jgi:hypothetical protein
VAGLVRLPTEFSSVPSIVIRSNCYNRTRPIAWIKGYRIQGKAPWIQRYRLVRAMGVVVGVLSGFSHVTIRDRRKRLCLSIVDCGRTSDIWRSNHASLLWELARFCSTTPATSHARDFLGGRGGQSDGRYKKKPDKSSQPTFPLLTGHF